MDVMMFSAPIGSARDLHPALQEMMKYPPEGVNYSKSFQKRGFVWEAMNRVALQPPIAAVDEKLKFDLVHTDNILISNKRRWVYGAESVHPLFQKYRDRMLKIILSENLRFIMPWSEASKKDFIKRNPEAENKLRVVHPTVSPKDWVKPDKSEDNINVLFVSQRGFYNKGGREALKAYAQVKDAHPKMNIQFTMVSNDVPDEFKQAFPSVRFLEPMKRDGLEQLYKEADIYMLPQYGDTYNMTCIEALSYGVPVITTDIYANPEFIEEGATGFMVKSISYFDMDQPGNFFEYCRTHEQPDVVSQLVERMNTLIGDKELRLRMGRAAKESVDSGRLSVERRKADLKSVYEDALA